MSDYEYVPEVEERTRLRIAEMVAGGLLSDKLCFVHCGERCDCAGGAHLYIYMEELERYKEEHERPQG